MYVIETNELRDLLRSCKDKKHELRNKVAVLSAALWGLTATENSLVSIGSVIKENGSIRSKWALPVHESQCDYEREIYTENKKHVEVLDRYLNWLSTEPGWRENVVTNLNEYRGLNPDARLLRNNNGDAFKLSTVKKEGGTNKVPSAFNTVFKKIIEGSELNGLVTYSDFRNSLVVLLSRSNTTERDIMQLMCIKDYRSVKRLIDTDTKTVESAIKNLFKKL